MFAMLEVEKTVFVKDKRLRFVVFSTNRVTVELSGGIPHDRVVSSGGEDSGDSHIHGAEGFRTHLRHTGLSSSHFFFLRGPVIGVCYHLIKQ
jgi:hypothetical protein